MLLTWHRRSKKKIMKVNRAANEGLKKKKRRKSNKTYKRKRRYVKTKRMK